MKSIGKLNVALYQKNISMVIDICHKLCYVYHMLISYEEGASYAKTEKVP